MKTLVLLGLAAAVVLVVVGYNQWSYLSTLSDKDRLSASSGYPIVGRQAPGFSLPDLGGNVAELGRHAGRPVVIDFWTTWCGLCVKEFPIFEAFHRAYADRVTFLSICSGSSEPRAAEMAAENGLTFPVYYDGDKTVARAYQPPVNRLDHQVTIFPFTVLIDASGKVVYAKAGIFHSVDELVTLLRRLDLLTDVPAA